MRNFCKHISCLILFLTPFMVQGQALPSLGIAPEIRQGYLPDGIRYYLVTNDARKGFADFALVQRGPRDGSRARMLLRELPHFGRRAPYRFLAEHGVGYHDDGYLAHPGGASLFSFRDVPTWDGSVADSTLLMLFDMAAGCSRPQAVIVCGDIDPERIRERMELLSMMVPALEDDGQGRTSAWTPADSLSLSISHTGAGEVAAIHAVFHTEPTPAELMNTPQPLVSRAYADQLGRIVRARVEKRLRSSGIPLAGFRYRYRDSAREADHEAHVLTLYTSAGQIGSATQRLASVLSSLDRNGAGMDEFLRARDAQIAEARREAARPLDNGDYLDKCIASFLYGANLASGEMLSAFIGTRRLDDERELQLFNGFARALLDSARNLTLRFDLPARPVDTDMLRQAFLQGWAAPDDTPAQQPAALPARSDPAKKVRLGADTAEPLSGGRLWTFSNGIKVIYKKMETGRDFRYALLLRGGAAEVAGLQRGESAFVGDMLGLSRVAGMSGEAFRESLEAEGIDMQAAATLSDLRITGRAPSGKLPQLMQALLSLSDERKPDRAAFDTYRKEEALRIDREALSPRDINALMDSILRPDYFYPERKDMTCLGDDLPERAEEYFASLFDKVGDGILVLIGDLDEEALKKELCRSLGGFRTQKRYSGRPRVESRFATGTITRSDQAAAGSAGGREAGAYTALSAAVPFSLDAYLSFLVACDLVRGELAAALTEHGARIELTHRLELFPSERLTLYIGCRPCPEDGLPAGVAPGRPGELLDALRAVTRHLDVLPLPEAGIEAYKELLLRQLDQRLSDPETLLETILTRYGEGKDLVTDYKAALRRVSSASVAHVLSQLHEGATVEYIIN